ncbi:MAG: hypothetical protein KGD63_11570 [Candidatus Lokiarchaeota archaeon]|nr:hypothetical protein [Candidatus Lokiarchaeota archaeon]
MILKEDKIYRKNARDFKGRIQHMKNTKLENLENLFLELYEINLNDYIEMEENRNPSITRKQIIVNMYKFHDKIRGKK